MIVPNQNQLAIGKNITENHLNTFTVVLNYDALFILYLSSMIVPNQNQLAIGKKIM